jgi:glycosyltransferase involved in cell wall biosynthesis
VTGLLVPARDPQALAAAILEAAGEPGRMSAIAARARRSAVERFGASRLVREIDVLYQRALVDARGLERPARSALDGGSVFR